MKHLILIIMICVIPLFAQDFFDSLEKSEQAIPYELNGFMRSAFFAGQNIESDELEQKSGYGELGLKMRVRKENFGDAYAELRFRRGYEFDESLSEFIVREAYVNTFVGNLDLRVGQQIVVWGRADGFNPTNNITPQNMLTRSSVDDDRRMGNFLFKADYHFNPFNLELIWVPQYRPSVLPTRLFQFPQDVEVTLGPADNPDARLKNGAIAAKIDLGLTAFDGSLSFYDGYMPLPGIFPAQIGVVGNNFLATIVNKPYRMQVFGGDFATTLGSFGLRGEVAYRKPHDDYLDDDNPHLPNPDMQYVFGIDRTFGDFSIIGQYIGRYVIDYEKFKGTGFPTDQLYLTNIMVAGQQEEISHAIFARPSLNMRHETLVAEFMAYYNITTEESLFRPLLSYDVTDAMTVKLGADLYAGPDNTLFGNIDKALSSVFCEFNISF